MDSLVRKIVGFTDEEEADPQKLFADLSKLYTLSDEDKFFVWMYYPFDILPIEQLMNIGNNLNIPHNIMLRKIIAWLIYNNSTDEEIINYLKEKNILTGEDNPLLQDIITEVRITPPNDLDIDNFRQAVDYGRSIVAMEKKRKEQDAKQAKKYDLERQRELRKVPTRTYPHLGYPAPHPDKGRPRMDWPVCAYKGCRKKFRYGGANALREHLESHGAHTWGFHWFHERACEKLFLTPEKVYAEGWTKCPSLVCDQPEFKSPKDLCHHLRILGIYPFWQWGTVVSWDDIYNWKPQHVKETKTKGPPDKPKVQEIQALSLKSFQKIYGDSDECLICFDAQPNAVLDPCSHRLMCLGCAGQMTKCPVCKTKIEKVIPY